MVASVGMEEVVGEGVRRGGGGRGYWDGSIELAQGRALKLEFQGPLRHVTLGM